MNRTKTTAQSHIINAIKSDWFLIFCLFISVTLVFFHWYEIFMIVPAFFVLNSKHLSKNCKSTSQWLLLFSLVYIFGCAIHDTIGSRTLFIIYCFPAIFYMAGSYWGEKYRNWEDVLIIFFFVFVIMYVAFDFYHLLYAIYYRDDIIIINRQILSEEGDVVRSATGYSTIMSLLIACLAFFLAPKQEGLLKWIRIIGIVLGLIALYGMATIVTRASIVEAVVVVMFSGYMMFTKNKTRGGVFGFVFGIVLLTLGLFYLIRNSNTMQFVDAFAQRNEEIGYGSDTAGGRTGLWAKAIEIIIRNPFGSENGHVSNTGGFAHNMWLDVGVRAGWLPFIILIVLTVRNIKQCFRLLKSNKYQYFTKLYFFSLFIMFMLSCFVEPVLDSVYNHFLIYIFFCGMINEMVKKQEIVC